MRQIAGLLLVALLLFGTSVAAEKKTKGGQEVTLSALAITPSQLTSQIQELAIAVTFSNPTQQPVTIYPNVAQPWFASGWGGPVFEAAIIAPQRRQVIAKEVRTYYGPPSQPPGPNYYAEQKSVLQPGGKLTIRIVACWLPRAVLKPEHLSPQTLDPQKLDGLAGLALADRSVIVLGQRCKPIEGEMKKRKDFLRPGQLLFLPGAGSYRVRLRYRQHPWVGFAPERTLELTSPEVAIGVR